MKVEQRVRTTPNATMTTLGSPTCGETSGLSVWRVEMADGASGPPHVVDRDQVWTVLSGALKVEADGASATLEAGESAVLTAGVVRQVTARGATEAIAAGDGSSVVRVPGEDGDRGTPPWMS